MQAPPSNAESLPMWTGRRGLVNTVACGVLGLISALGLMQASEVAVIRPVCSQHAVANRTTYIDYKIVGVKQQDVVVCMFRGAGGQVQEARLSALTSYAKSTGVGLAVNLQITVPAMILLWAIARSAPHLIGRRGGA